MTEQNEPAEEEPLGPKLSPNTGWRGRQTIFVFVLLALATFRVGGDALYDPPSRLPAQSIFTSNQNLLGRTNRIQADLDEVARLFPPGAPLTLTPVGEVHELPLPRTLADRIFNERQERVLVLTGKSSAGEEHKFLILTEGHRTLYGIGSLGTGADSLAGYYVLIPDEPAYTALLAALERLQDEIKDKDRIESSSDDFSIFGPFARGNREMLQARFTDNVVLAHLVEALDGKRADVSVMPAVILIAAFPEHGAIRALYSPAYGAVLEPLWEDSSVSTLAHELVHAYMDRIERERREKLSVAATHFEKTHPLLFSRVLSELYDDLDRLGRAEEAVANIAGSLAAGRITTVETAVAIRSRDLAELGEPIHMSDVQLLIDFELLPECMGAETLDYTEEVVTFEYYELAREGCT